MQHTYILVEGINIYANVLDTNQLSVIRGSSFALKQAIEQIKSSFDKRLIPITTGASSGLFQVDAGVDLDTLMAEIAAKLKTSPYCHFTFVIEQCQAEELLQAKEQLLSQLRFHQLNSITKVPDYFNKKHHQEAYPCQLEGCRIAATKTKRTVQGQLRNLSLSVCERLDFGRKQRQDFYFDQKSADFCKVLHGYSFTDDLENIADNSRYPKLNKKIAVIYIDGNKFSSIQREVLQRAKQNKTDQIEAQREFDSYLQEKRSLFLMDTLQEMVPPKSRFKETITQNSDGKDAIRFETLLWGGDEMLFVLPAWSGFELLQSFFQKSADWKIDDELLTHAAGIVFCSAKTPIRIIRDIAQSLADTIKDGLGDERKKNSWDYMVLESIDYPVNNDIAAFNQARYGKELADRRPHYFLPVANWDSTKKEFIQLITDSLLSRRQLYRVATALHQQNPSGSISWNKIIENKEPEKSQALWESATPQELAERRMFQLLESESDRKKLAKILSQLARDLFHIDIQCAENRAWLWLNLIELWDYLVPQEED